MFCLFTVCTRTFFSGVHGHLSQPIPWAYCDECALDESASLVGGKPCEVALMNGLTVNIHVLLVGIFFIDFYTKS